MTSSTATDTSTDLRLKLLPSFRSLHHTTQEADAGPALALALVADAVHAQASDIHIDPATDHYRVRFRIDGKLINTFDGEPTEGHRLVNQFRVLSRIDPAEIGATEGHWTGEVDDQLLDLRTTFVPTVLGDKMSARILGTHLASMDLYEVGLDAPATAALDQWLASPNGMIVVAGPTGSGKTTLLYAIARRLATPDASVVTLEDPVEHPIDSMTQIDIGQPLGLGFEQALKTALRLDPDYLMVGETRDKATAEASLQAVNCGHALLTSTHSENAVGVVDRFRNWDIDDRELAAALRFVIATRLVRRLCPACSTTQAPDEVDRRWLEAQNATIPTTIPQAVGCEVCHGIGYAGQLPLFDCWRIDEEAAARIASGTATGKLREAAKHPIASTGITAAEKGWTTIRELRTAGL